MKYENIVKGIFVNRPNRFIAKVRVGEGFCREVTCHVKNTGRCKELLIPGAEVLLQFHPQAERLGRKTSYSLIGVYKNCDGKNLLINMDSQAPNQAAYEWLADRQKSSPIFLENGRTAELSGLRREVAFGQSRFDLAFDLTWRETGTSPQKAFMEVKGVTLERDKTALFPDAPTERGVKHVMELTAAVRAGYRAYLLFVIQMKGIQVFAPNRETHPEFGRALTLAQQAGVRILAYDCAVTVENMEIDSPVPLRL